MSHPDQYQPARNVSKLSLPNWGYIQKVSDEINHFCTRTKKMEVFKDLFMLPVGFCEEIAQIITLAN